MNDPEYVYVCGGNYPKTEEKATWREPGLVRPTGGGPYVAQTLDEANRLFEFCKHHAHLYEVDTFMATARLLRRGQLEGEAFLRLSKQHYEEIMLEVRAGRFWSDGQKRVAAPT